jgi:CBS domain-containing protein
VGIITDGDLRRSLKEVRDLNLLTAEKIMCKSPQVVRPNMSLGSALEIMEGGHSPISVLPVIKEKTTEVMGLIRLHDIFTPQSN